MAMGAGGLNAAVGRRTRKGTKVTEQMVSRAAYDQTRITILEDNTQEVLSALPRAAAAALEAIGLQAEGYAKKLCPVDTGRLRNSITHTVEFDGLDVYAVIGTNVEYAPYVEEGHSLGNGKVSKGAHFLRKAASDHPGEYRKIVERYLRDA